MTVRCAIDAVSLQLQKQGDAYVVAVRIARLVVPARALIVASISAIWITSVLPVPVRHDASHDLKEGDAWKMQTADEGVDVVVEEGAAANTDGWLRRDGGFA